MFDNEGFKEEELSNFRFNRDSSKKYSTKFLYDKFSLIDYANSTKTMQKLEEYFMTDLDSSDLQDVNLDLME
jgi:hypothetical protein